MKIILMPTVTLGRSIDTTAPTIEIVVPSDDLNLDDALDRLVKPALLAFGYPSERVEAAISRAIDGE
jgi:hypothetical protein